uniref:Uncharacterized protein n=2 Tax=Cacopsylla melanoneura TaxID=428564 RepID=A0A8D8TEQ8_9HEMI
MEKKKELMGSDTRVRKASTPCLKHRTHEPTPEPSSFSCSHTSLSLILFIMIVLIGDSILFRLNKNCPIPDSLCLAQNGASVTPLPNNPNQPYFYDVIHSQYFLVNPAVDHKNFGPQKHKKLTLK